MIASILVACLAGLWVSLAVADDVRVKSHVLKTDHSRYAVKLADESLPAFLRKQAM